MPSSNLPRLWDTGQDTPLAPFRWDKARKREKFAPFLLKANGQGDSIDWGRRNEDGMPTVRTGPTAYRSVRVRVWGVTCSWGRGTVAVSLKMDKVSLLEVPVHVWSGGKEGSGRWTAYEVSWRKRSMATLVLFNHQIHHPCLPSLIYYTRKISVVGSVL